jgi:uncharacterized membrane protein required for colicin V production
MAFLYELLGWLGSVFFLSAYYNLVAKNWSSTTTTYHIFNIIGAFCFVINGIYYTAWAVVFINITWGLIACYGLCISNAE